MLSSYSVNVPVVPHLVDRHEFYIASGTPASVIGWAQKYRPPGSRQDDNGTADQGAHWTSFSFPSVRGFASSPDLLLDAVPMRGAKVAIRVDAQVAPRPRLPGNGRGPGNIRIVDAVDMLGSVGYDLRCDPAGGTIPDPARICAAIAGKPALLYSFPGPDHSCPFASSVSLDGRWNGKPLHSTFSVCTGGQEALAGSWAQLLPDETAVATVHIDRGIGLVRLGESEAIVVDLLRGQHPAPTPCGRCTRSFDENFSIGYGARGSERAGWTVGFAGSQVTRIETDIDVKMRGGYMTFDFARFRQRLPGWHVRTCGSDRALVHSSSTGQTLVLFKGSTFQRIVITAARSGC
jgi:hypothetical protein